MHDDRNIASQWAKYHQSGDRKAFNCLMNHYVSIVISTAKKIHRRTGLSNLENLVGAGIWRLWDSIEIYRMPQTTDFTKYARRRIRREMVEAVKKGSRTNA